MSQKEEKKKSTQALKKKSQTSQSSANQSQSISRTSSKQSKQFTKTQEQSDWQEINIKPLKQEMKQLETLRSVLWQWKLANALGEQGLHLQQDNARQELYDRCRQLVDLKIKHHQAQSVWSQTQKIKLLDQIIQGEYSTLVTLDENIIKSAGFLADFETGIYNSLHRMHLAPNTGVIPHRLKEQLEGCDRILKHLNTIISAKNQNESISRLAEKMKRLEEITNQEKDEITKCYVNLKRLWEIQQQERTLVISKIQAARENKLLELVNEDL